MDCLLFLFNLLIVLPFCVGKDKTTLYKTKYQEIDQELITEIKDFCPIET